MITLLLLFIIYITFISLGLPDAILGVTWPVMREEFGVSIDMIGYVSIIITISTVISSLASGYLIEKLGTGKVTLFSVLLTALAIFGISVTPSFYWLLLLAFPLGFGAGSIDTALNNYVALHFKAHHMNWLHSFWGVGATLGPIIISFTILSSGWRNGVTTIALIQIIIFAFLLLSLPLWNKVHPSEELGEEMTPIKKPKNLIRERGVFVAVLVFIIYCAIEFSVGLWGSSYLVDIKYFNPDNAARIVAMYYLGITIGRFISGFLSFKLDNRQMIYLGLSIITLGVLLLNASLPTSIILIPFIIIGLGLSPIFPAMIHETPKSFGKGQSQYVIGYQMAGAYIGGSIFPPLFGIIARFISVSLFPYFIAILTIILVSFILYLYRYLLPQN